MENKNKPFSAIEMSFPSLRPTQLVYTQSECHETDMGVPHWCAVLQATDMAPYRCNSQKLTTGKPAIFQ